MSDTHAGGCLCGDIRYETTGAPARVTVCHCRFCQRATGSAYMVEPIFRCEDLAITAGTPATYDTVSAGSGKRVTIHFCSRCGTKLYMTFERFVGSLGVYAGTFDEPDWFEVEPGTSKHIFVDVARPDSILPADVPTYAAHAITNEGQPLDPVFHPQPHPIGRLRS